MHSYEIRHPYSAIIASMREAILYEGLERGKIRCFLCAHRCLILPGKRGICAVRENIDGVLYSLVYGKVVASNTDPIEKKPLFHFLPGSMSYSIATVGCNLRCQHCQNYEISQFPRERPDVAIPGRDMTPEEVAEAARRAGCQSISYTYTEPTIFLEFALDCAKSAQKTGIKNVFVSNGFMSPESAKLAAGIIDANNIDLKGDENFYKKICEGRAEPVKETIKIMKSEGVWVEVTTLIIPGHNDSDQTLGDIASFIHSVDPALPWHVTQFYPTYQLMDSPRTPLETLRRAVEIGHKAGLKYVYEGNVPGAGGENTFCSKCGELVIKRLGFAVLENNLRHGACPHCGAKVDGVWE